MAKPEIQGSATEVSRVTVIRRELAERIFASGILDDIATAGMDGTLDDRDAMADAESIAAMADDHYRGAVEDFRSTLEALAPYLSTDGKPIPSPDMRAMREIVNAAYARLGGQ